MSAQHNLNPSHFSQDELKVIAFALVGELRAMGVTIGEKLLTKEQAAKELKITYKTFERRLSSGHYPARIIHRDGGTMLFIHSEIIKYVASL